MRPKSHLRRQGLHSEICNAFYFWRCLRLQVLELLTDPAMLEVFDDPLAKQAKRLQTSAGAALPENVYFETCPAAGQAPLSRQRWSFDHTTGHITNAQSGRVLTLSNCGNQRRRVGLCAAGAEPSDGPASCKNSSCPAAAAWSNASSGALMNKFDGGCLEGMLGPGRSSVVTATCAAAGQPANPTQHWAVLDDGTVRAYSQCLTAELMAPATPPPVDVFAVPLANGDAAVVFFNRDSTKPAAGTVGFSGRYGEVGAHIRNKRVTLVEYCLHAHAHAGAGTCAQAGENGGSD